MEHVGKHVKVVQNDGSQYEGYIHSMDGNTGKLTLHKGRDFLHDAGNDILLMQAHHMESELIFLRIQSREHVE